MKSSAGEHPRSIVSRKIKLTLLTAAVGSLITMAGGRTGSTLLLLLGLIIVAASPYISLLITLLSVRREDA